MEDIKNIIIIGSGPAGLTAAIYLGRANYKPLLISGVELGGQLMTTTDIENFPGFPEGISGPQLMQNMIKQAQKFGTEIKYEKVIKVDLAGEIKKIFTEKNTYLAKAIIIATGSTAKKLNIPSETKYWGKGVSACATCDGAFYKEKIVAVVGGGDTAMEEASFLTRFASKVNIIHRRDAFRASKIMQEHIFKNPKIEIIWNSQIKEIIGNNIKVTALKLLNNENKEKEIAVDGLFLAIGHNPNTNFLGQAIELDDVGYIRASSTTTKIPGVFVAGDVRDPYYRQAISAAGFGCMAAIDCEKWLEN